MGERLGVDLLISVEAHPLSLIELFWDLLAFGFELGGLFLLVLQDLLDVLAEFKCEDSAIF